MRRREFVTVLGMATAWPSYVAAQLASRRPLVAFLSGLSAERASSFVTAFARRMEELGHASGRNVDIVYRYTDGDTARLSLLVDEVVRLKPDVVVVGTAHIAAALRQLTAELPIISAVIGNANAPALGLVGLHARPQGNVTGVLNNVDTLAGKMVELATEALGGATRLGVLHVPGFQQHAADRKNVEMAAGALGIEIVPAEVRVPNELNGAFQTMKRERISGVLVFGHSMFLNERQRIAALAIGVRLPTVFPFREHVEAGGFMSYGVDLRASFRRVADFADKILKGAKTGDLPVELPTRFELVVNVKTAKAIGLAISEALLVRADEVIE